VRLSDLASQAHFFSWESYLMRRIIVGLCVFLPLATAGAAQAPIRIVVDTATRQYRIPPDFVGLGFETKSMIPNAYGVHGYFFSPDNHDLITLFRNIGIRNIRVGGGTVDGSGSVEHCATPVPGKADVDSLFAFARAVDINVIYSVRLLNLAACANPHLAQEDAAQTSYVWNTYRDRVTSIAIGNEPDVREYHSNPARELDPAVYESVPGVPGSAYPSWFVDWKQIAAVVRKTVPGVRLSGPDTAVSDTSSFTPNPAAGVSWTVAFSEDLSHSGDFVEALQHHYVWGQPRNTTATEAIDSMLSSAWDDGTEVGQQPAYDGGHASFHPYPFVYRRVLEPLVRKGIAYRMTEANDCLHGVPGASDSFASALWALDYMHWWAAHRMAGVNFHNNPWIPTDTIVPAALPCPSSGCEHYRVAPKALGLKAFSLGSDGYVESMTLDNPQHLNLTAYAVGTGRVQYITIINKSHESTHDVKEAEVTILLPNFGHARIETMTLTDGEPGHPDRMSGTLGGSAITSTEPWSGKWVGVPADTGDIRVHVPASTAVIVRATVN
jgi:hypothetical protein